MKWDETDEHQELANEIGGAGGDDDLAGGAAGFSEDEGCADPTWNEQEHYDVQADDVDAIVDSGDYQEAEVLESSESPAGYEDEEPAEYQEVGVDGYVEPPMEYEATDPVCEEPEATYEEVEADSTEPAYEPQATEQELETGEDADDEEAETFGDWEKGFDPSTNHYFWFNHASGESSWEPPEDWPFEVDEPFEAEGEFVAEDGEAVEQMEGAADEPGYSNDGGDAEIDDGEYTAAEEGAEVAGNHDDPVTRTSEFGSSRVSDFEFDDNDLPTF